MDWRSNWHAVSAWIAWRSFHARLIVTPQVSQRTREERNATSFSVRVTNLSPFDVTLERVALALRGNDRTVHSQDLDNQTPHKLPRELKSREAIVISLTVRTTIAIAIERFDHAFAETACGVKARSSRWHPFKGKTLDQILQPLPNQQARKQ